MAENSGIRWTHNTFNPWMGCMKVSDGCKHCYAETLLERYHKGALWGPAKTTARQRTSPANWAKPKRWNADAQAAKMTTRVFSGSLCDVFEDHPDANAARPDLFALWRATPFLQWQILTKRPENIAGMLPADWERGYPNVWLGTSIEDMRVAHRLAELVKNQAVVHFISYEPALGPLDELDIAPLKWIIYGGESGPGYREHDLAWPRSMRNRCADLGVAFYYKQESAPRTEMGIELDGERIEQYPVPQCLIHPELYKLPALFGSVFYDDVIRAQYARMQDDLTRPASAFGLTKPPEIKGYVAPRAPAPRNDLPLFGK